MNEVGDPTHCGTVKRHVKDKWINAPTILKCNQNPNNKKPASRLKFGWTGCRDDRLYVLAGDPDSDYATPELTIPVTTLGLRRFHFLEYDPKNLTATPKNITTNATTWYGLEHLLEPTEIVGNSDHCGYYFMPYDTFLKSNFINPNYGTDTPAFSYMDIEWDKSSFAGSSSNSKYALFKNSTYTYRPPKFTSSLDFNKVQ